MSTNFGTSICPANKCVPFYLQWITLCKVCAKDFAFSHAHVCDQNNVCLHTYQSNIFMKRIHTARSSIYILHLCASLYSPGPGPGVHTHAQWLVGVLLHLPQYWLDKWVMIKAPVTNCSAASISLTLLSVYRVCVLWNSSLCIGTNKHTLVVAIECVYRTTHDCVL